MTTNIELKIQGLDQDILVARFDGHEGISELFQLDLLLVGDATHPVGFDDVLGKDACFTLWGKKGMKRCIHGIVSRFQQADVQGQSIGYVTTIVPRVHRLLHRHDCRIFQPPDGSTITVKDIIPKVLQAASLTSGKDFRLALSATYTPRDYCAQYRESDWAFLSRLMEEEGIHYFFEHHEDKHVLVIADSSAPHDDLEGGPIRFHATMGALTGGDHIDRFHLTGSLRSDKFTVRDYNFEKPRDLLESKDGSGKFEIYDYPGGYAVPANGDQRAKMWLEEQRMQTKRGQGDSRCQRLVPGSVFELREHPIEAMNQKYLITRVDHLGHSPDITGQGGDEPAYENRFVVIPKEVTFRAPRTTPRPVVTGVQTAVVICPSGDEVEPDKYGRVKVRFNWDRENKSSYWVRVGQTWAGAGFGAMFIPRKGQEVIVDFLEGDPDRPVIVGSLYHGVNVTPYNLPADKTKSTIKTSTVPGGGGFNELRFEDKKGSEEVYLHAQKDHNVDILNDEKVTIGHDRTVAVKNDEKLDVTGNQSIHVGKNRTDAVDGDETRTVKGQRTRTVEKSESVTIKADQTLKVSGDRTENVDGNTSVSVGKDRTDHVAGKVKERVDGDATLQFKGNVSTTIEGGETFEIKQAQTLKVGEKISITCGSAKVTVSKDGTISIEGGDVSISANSGITVKGGKLQVESSGAVTVKGGNVVVQGGTVGLN